MNPNVLGVIGPGFLNQVPTLQGILDGFFTSFYKAPVGASSFLKPQTLPLCPFWDLPVAFIAEIRRHGLWDRWPFLQSQF